jgi:MoaA/NifB/PqqE/SkfB family radical SAM enzyme
MRTKLPPVPLFQGIPAVEELADFTRAARPLILGIPLAASPTYRKCQLDCGFCFVEREERGAFLTLREHLGVIDRFAEAGGRYVRTATVGEPFLDRMFFNPDGVAEETDAERSRFPLIDHANRRGLFWTSFSNLLGVTEAVAEELGDRDVSLIGKLHAMDPAIQEQMTGNTGHYAPRHWDAVGEWRVPRQLKLLMDAGLHRPRPGDPPGTSRLAVDIVATRVNVRHIPDVVGFCLENNIYPFLEMLELFGTAVDAGAAYGLSRFELEWLHARLRDLVGEEFFSREARARTNRFCPALTAGLIYNPDGRVRFCYCANSPSRRNVRSDDLLVVFRELGEERRAIRAEIEALGGDEGSEAALSPCPMGAFGRPLLGSAGCRSASAA